MQKNQLLLGQLNKIGLLCLAILTILTLSSSCGCHGGSLPISGGSSPLPESAKQQTCFVFKECQDLANNLTASKPLEHTYQALKNKVVVQVGTNNNANFVGIDGMKSALRKQPGGEGDGDLNKFKQWAQAGEWQKFHNAHYDWWMYPIDRHSIGQGFKYTVFQGDIQTLKADAQYLQDYRLGAILLMASWGWDMPNKKMYRSLVPHQKWQNWDVRMVKLGHSLILFEQWDLYASVEAYVQYLTNSDVRFTDSYMEAYFPILGHT